MFPDRMLVYMAALSVSDILVQIVNILFLVRKFEGHEVLRHGTCGLVFFLLYFSIHYNVIVMIGMTVESLVVLNVLIVQQMKSARKFRDTSTCKEQGDQSRQVTTMLLLVTCAFLVLIGPMAVIIVVERYYWARNTPEEQAAYHLTRVVCNNLSYTNHAINFILYCLRSMKRESISSRVSRPVPPHFSGTLG
nr:hypothetical protein BaRGS_002618 [Batillaria attramentaria]